MDDLYAEYGGSKMPPKTIAGLLLCRIVVICLIGAAAIVAITVCCPHENNRDAITVLVGFLGAAIVGLLSLAKQQENAYMIKENHAQTNTKLDDIASSAKDTAHRADIAASKAGEAASKTSQTLLTIQSQTHTTDR